MKIISLIILACSLAGCGNTSADLRTYRDGQWVSLGPVLDLHTLIMQQARTLDAAYAARQAAPNDPATATALSNAVIAIRRSQGDSDAVTQMIASIRKLHDGSVAHDAAATQPAVSIP